MGVTVNVNNLSLAHKSSNGIAIATIPDVCKTPSPGGPVPIPYPNIARSGMLSKGSKKVKADGGNMVAIKGSEFSMSNGDEAGVAGGVKSSTNMKEAKWILYSFDVKIEGKNACRLTDKMTMNHENTVCLGGFLQEFLSGPKGPTECAKLLERIKTIIGEGMTGKKDGIRGLEERFAQQITGEGSPTAPMDRGPSSDFPNGSNSWTRHDREIQRQQESLKKHLDAYDNNCGGGPPPPLNAREWVTRTRPAPSQWTGHVAATGVSVGIVATAIGLTVLTAIAVLSPFDGPVGDIAAGTAAAGAWAVIF